MGTQGAGKEGEWKQGGDVKQQFDMKQEFDMKQNGFTPDRTHFSSKNENNEINTLLTVLFNCIFIVAALVGLFWVKVYRRRRS